MAKTPAAVYEGSSWTTAYGPTSKSTTDFNVSAGDALVVFAASEQNLPILSVSNSGTGLVWTKQQEGTYVPGFWCWTAPVNSAQTGIHVTVSIDSNTDEYGFVVLRYASAAIGATSMNWNQSGNAVTTSLTITHANCGIACFAGDYSGQDQSSHTWQTINASTGTQQQWQRIAGIYTTGTNTWSDAGTAGAKTVGLTETDWTFTVIAVEVYDQSGQTINVGQAVETDTAQPVTMHFSPQKILVGQAIETDTAFRLYGWGSRITLKTVWLNEAGDLADLKSFPSLSEMKVDTGKNVTVRRLPNGKNVMVTKPGTARTYTLTMPGCDREQIAWLENHVGELVCVRDDRQRKVWGVYFTVEVDERRTTADYGDASVTLNQVTHQEEVE